MIKLTKENKPIILAKLYNASKPQGLGMLHFDPTPMTAEQAKEILNSGQTYFDYLKGRVMKIDLSGDEIDVGLYDRDNGPGAAKRALAGILS